MQQTKSKTLNNMIKNKKEISTLTKAEMEIMNILWDEAKPMSTHAIIERYPEPKPAYSTIATFMGGWAIISYKKNH